MRSWLFADNNKTGQGMFEAEFRYVPVFWWTQKNYVVKEGYVRIVVFEFGLSATYIHGRPVESI